MSVSKKLIIAGFLLGTLIFILSPSFQEVLNDQGFWNMKEQLLYLTGSIAMVYMVISMILSVRIERINKIVGGLDKAYVVHKWVGIWAFAFSILHWVIKEAPKLLVQLQLAPPKVRREGTPPFSEFGASLFDLGNSIVEIAFYIMVAVLIISLIKKIPYHIFRLIHKTLPLLFLGVAFHSATIQIKGDWFGSIGSFLLWPLIIIGTIAAFIELFQLIGKNRQVKSVISKINYDKSGGILDIHLSLPQNRFSYQAGQYVFLKFDFCSEPHPFSIASYDKNMKTIRIIIKELGDYTQKLPTCIKEGDSATIEGPYGEFTFEDDSRSQVWIAGGIGVTPFMARLEYLVENNEKDAKNIDFFFTTRGESPLKPALEDLCKKAGVNFHYNDTSKSARLCLDTLKEKVKNLTEASLWYCGPTNFCNNLKNSMKKSGQNLQLHYDNFDMR